MNFVHSLYVERGLRIDFSPHRALSLRFLYPLRIDFLSLPFSEISRVYRLKTHPLIFARPYRLLLRRAVKNHRKIITQ